jgi:ferredoxin
MKRKYIIEYDRENCIGAAACAVSGPDFWEMDDDAKANLINGKSNSDNTKQTRELELDEDGLNSLLESARVCPVTVIKVIDKETGENLV